MRVVPPVIITDLKLTSSTATEPFAPDAYDAGTTYLTGEIVSVAADFAIYESQANANTGNTPNVSPLWWKKIWTTEAVYDVETTYAAGDIVSSTTYHRRYESLAGSNTGNPLPVPPETTTTYWLDIGPTNKWAMFDYATNQQTICAYPLTVVFAPGERINTVGLTGLSNATSAVISATSTLGGGLIFGPLTIDLNTRKVFDQYDYAFEPFSTAASTVILDIPPYSDVVVTVTLVNQSGYIKCGAISCGTNVYIGGLQNGATNDGWNFSTIDRDVFGNATLVPRRTLPKTEQSLWLNSQYVDRAKAVRVNLNATPALWVGLDDSTSNWFDTFAIMGIYTQFKIGAVVNNVAEISLSLEEI